MLVSKLIDKRIIKIFNDGLFEFLMVMCFGCIMCIVLLLFLKLFEISLCKIKD